MDKEIWCDIPGFEGAYQISDLGRVRSLDRLIRYPDNHLQCVCGRVLRLSRQSSGHYKVSLGRKNWKLIHALVMLTFVGPYPKRLEIRHLNGIPGDNRLVNLEYTTRSRNVLDVKWHGGRTDRRLTPQDVLNIKRRLASVPSLWGTGSALAKEYGVSPVTISNIRHGQRHKDVTLPKHSSEIGPRV